MGKNYKQLSLEERTMIQTQLSMRIKGVNQRGQAHIVIRIQHHNPSSPCPTSRAGDSSHYTRGLPRGLASRRWPVVASILA